MEIKGNERLLDLAALRQCTRYQEPFWWAHSPKTFVSREVAQALRDTFPAENYQHFLREQGRKRHSLHGTHLLGKNNAVTGLHFPPLWSRLAEELQSPEYRQALGELSGVSLAGLGMEVTLWRQPQGGFLDPHPDNPDKVLIHLTYFSDEAWEPRHGGCMRMLRSNDIEDVGHEIPPRLDTSVIFRRADNSWHGYKPIVVPDQLRLALQVVFHEPQLAYASHDY